MGNGYVQYRVKRREKHLSESKTSRACLSEIGLTSNLLQINASFLVTAPKSRNPITGGKDICREMA